MTSLAACWTETFGERTRTTKPTTESRRQKSNCSFLLIFSMKMAMTQTKMQFCRIGPIYRFVVDFVVATFFLSSTRLFFVVNTSTVCRRSLDLLSSTPNICVVDPQYVCRRPKIFLSSPPPYVRRRCLRSCEATPATAASAATTHEWAACRTASATPGCGPRRTTRTGRHRPR